MDEVLSAAPYGPVMERLDYLDALVTDADETSLAALAAGEVPRLTGAWRALLDRHRPDKQGRCSHCHRWRRGRTSCSVWATAHEHLIAADGAPSPTSYGAVRHATTVGSAASAPPAGS